MDTEIRFEINGKEILPHQLRESLQDESTSKALFRLANQLHEHLGPMRCPRHKQPPSITVVMAAHQSGFRIKGCCEPFIEQTGQALRRLFKPTAQPGSQVKLRITVQNMDKPFIFDADLIDELVIGRFDPDTGKSPDIDLHQYSGYENGVSRQHAAILWRNGALNLLDKGTPNGTYLNGQRLGANQTHLLRDGDLIRVGRLVLEVALEYPSAKKSLLS